MKKMLFSLTAFCFILFACVPNPLQSQVADPTSMPEADIQSTVAFQVEQTLQSLPTATLLPSHTAVVITATSIPSKPSTPTEIKTETMTASAVATVGTVTLTTSATGTLPFTVTATPGVGVTATGTAHYQYYGTMPPNLPSGNISLLNMSKADAYISMQCTTVDGYTTIIEYPLGGSRVNTSAPAGQYIYVAWVGGEKFTGRFKLNRTQELLIRLHKDRIEIK